MSEEADLEGCMSRLMWANHQLNALDEETRVWLLEHNPDAASVEYYPEADVHVFRLNPDTPPLRFGVVACNIVHQLRATLDNLVWQLVIANQQTPRGGIGGNQFPIHTSLDKDRTFAQRTASHLRGVHPDHAALIEWMQPYQTPDWPAFSPQLSIHPLRRLADFSNVDKHQILKVVGFHQPVPAMLVRFDSDTATAMSSPGWFPPEQRQAGAIVGWVHALPSGFHPDMDMKYAGMYWLTFEDGLPIISTLRVLALVVEVIVTCFREIFEGSRSVDSPLFITPEGTGQLYQMTRPPPQYPPGWPAVAPRI